MSKAGKSAPVLEGDKALRFPHALLISASAGSGKTYTLAQRYVQFLLSERVPGNDLPNILAVTFTNLAAKEMKGRILAWLKALARGDEEALAATAGLVSLSRAEIVERAGLLVERVISDYSDFHIQTIDSFLTRVMAASSDELGLPLKPRIVMSYDVLLDLALYSLFSRIGRGLPAETVDKFLAVLPKTGTYAWNPALRIKENFDSFLNQEGKTSASLAAPGGDAEALLKAKFPRLLDHCEKLVKRFGAEYVRPKCAAAMEARSLTDFLAAYNYKFGVFNGVKKGKFPPGWEKDLEHLHDLVIEVAELNAASYYHPYVGLYERFKAELERVKRGKNDVIHISDIARRLAAYIKADNVPEIYLRLGERIGHFLIDEFQDTNRLQWDVIRPLVEEGLSKTGSLFVVGDIKQAIYMFRNADYRIMRDLLDKAEGKKSAADNISLEPLDNELAYVNLPVNYRSDGEVLRYVDRLFKEKLKVSGLAGEDITELTAYSQAVQAGRVKAGYVKTDILETESLDEPEGQREWLLRAVKSAGERYPLGEIAVLVGKNKRIEPVVEWLTAAGVPVASLSSLDIRKRRVVAELLAWLRFLETPSDDLAFASFLTGEVFGRLTGLKREELEKFIFEARRSGGKGLLYSAFRKDGRLGRYWEQFLDEPFRKVGYLPLYELVSLVFGRFRVFANFPEEQAFLARLLEAVSALEAEGVTSPRAFAEYAAGKEADKEKLFSITLPDYVDAVRVMTYHKSKGLGFSAVINLMYDEADPSSSMYFEEKDGAIHVYHITKDAAERSVKLRPVYEARRKDEAVQELNVLYVVSTRARHELHTLVIKKKRKEPAKEARLPDLFEAYEAGAPAARRPGKRPGAAPVVVAPPGARAAARFEGLAPTYKSFYETAEGELVHAILARFAALPDRPEEAVAAAYDELAPAYPFRFDKARLVRSLLAFLSNSEAAALFAAAPGRETLVEAEFISRDGALFRMDRVLVDKDLVTVVDFKTGRDNTAKYLPQLKNYLAIVSEVYNKPARGILAYTDLNKIVSV